MKEYGLIAAAEAHKWTRIVSECFDSDIYHTAAYHRLCELHEEGQAALYFFRHHDRLACFPLMLRDFASGHRDATSVYGYPGALTSAQSPDPEFAAEFQQGLRQTLRDQRIVTVFSRLHPLIETDWLLKGIASLESHGATVWIDLRRSEEEQMAAANQQHRRHLRKARGHGITFRLDDSFRHLETFIDMYESNMRRIGASARYFFPREYYRFLTTELAPSTKLFLAELDGRILSATIAFTCRKFIHYHLNGTPQENLAYNCPRLLLNEIRIWGQQNQYHWLNLGGGVGARGDTLFQFKAGFSDLHLPFRTARIVLDNDTYADLISAHAAGEPAASVSEFFPRYRAQRS